MHLRLQLIDAVTNFPFKDKFILAKDFEPESIKAYIKESIKDLPLNTIVSDGHLAYPKIIQELGANQQSCQFHIMENLMFHHLKIINNKNRTIKRNTTKIKNKEQTIEKMKQDKKEKEYRKPTLKKRKEKLRKLRIEVKKLKNENRRIKKEIKAFNKIKDQISKLLGSKSIKTATKRLEKIKSNIEDYHEIYQNCIRKIEKQWDQVTLCMKNRQVPNTNNKIELYFNVTLFKPLKRKYRTLKGIMQHTELKRQRWIRRNTNLKIT